MKRKLLIIICFSLFGLLLSLYLLFWQEKESKLTEKETVPVQTIKEITEVVKESQKIDSFILSKLPTSDVFFKREQYSHSHDSEEEESSEQLKKEAMRFVYSAFMLQDVDQLTVAFSSKSIRSLQDKNEQLDPFKLTQRLTEFLSLVNRDGSIEKLEYQFELDEYLQETNKGILTIVYKNKQEIKIKIEVEEVGDEDHRAFEVVTPLSEIEKLVKPEQ